MTRTVLFPGIALNCVTTAQFKTNVMTVYFLRRLDESEAALNALLPCVLRRGNKKHPDLKSLSDALADLYGASLLPIVLKRGEWHCFGLGSSFISGNLDGAARLLLDTLLDPVLGGYAEPERENLINRIRSLKNDKASYAAQRLDALAFAGEPYAVGRFGSEDAASAITKCSFEEHYYKVLKTSRIELFYCGDVTPDEVVQILHRAFAGVERRFSETAHNQRVCPPEAPKSFTEYEDVTQAKLAVLWRAEEFRTRRDFLEAYAACTIYGGDAGKLFSHVRERLSLCYYADAQLDRHKCVMKARSGVEVSNIDRARCEMLAQWDAVVSGDFSDSDLEHAKASMLNSWISAGDSPAGLESFWQGQAAAGFSDSLDDWANGLETVGKNGVVEAARRFSLDTVYCMRSEQ